MGTGVVNPIQGRDERGREESARNIWKGERSKQSSGAGEKYKSVQEKDDCEFLPDQTIYNPHKL